MARAYLRARPKENGIALKFIVVSVENYPYGPRPSTRRPGPSRRTVVDSRTAPVVGDRDRPHAAQRIAAIGGAGGHDFRGGWRDDGRDALYFPSPPPAGRRGSRDPEPDDNALGHAAAGLAGRGTGTDVGVTGLAARPRSPFKRHHAAPSCGRGRRAMAAVPSAPARARSGRGAGYRTQGADAMVKNRNRLRSRAASTPCASSASISASSSVKLLVMPMRSETWMRK